MIYYLYPNQEKADFRWTKYVGLDSEINLHYTDYRA